MLTTDYVQDNTILTPFLQEKFDYLHFVLNRYNALALNTIYQLLNTFILRRNYVRNCSLSRQKTGSAHPY